MAWLYRSRKRCDAIPTYVSGEDMWRRCHAARDSAGSVSFAAT
jgi:hypothetical protein